MFSLDQFTAVGGNAKADTLTPTISSVLQKKQEAVGLLVFLKGWIWCVCVCV